MNFCGSYRPDDVTFLLKRLPQLPFVDIARKEQLIQSGARHYSEMLSPEVLPSPRYLDVFRQACAANRQQMARDCLKLAALIANRRSGPITLVVTGARRYAGWRDSQAPAWQSHGAGNSPLFRFHHP
jgi:hypothetical protein